MPIYCFTSKSGETIEEHFAMGKAPDFVTRIAMHELDGVEQPKKSAFFRDRPAEWESGPRSGEKGTWPIECYASGVNAAQAPELRRFFKKHNVDCDVTNNGDPVYKNHQHRKRCLKARGFCDKASFGT